MKKISSIIIAAGILCLAAAAAIAFFNQYTANKAGETSESLLEIIENGEAGIVSFTDTDEAPQTADTQGEEAGDNISDGLSNSFVSDSAYSVGEWMICGTLEIPVIGLKLPVMAEYSEALLRLAPCRYTDNGVPSDKLVIAGHNFNEHFGYLGNLVNGDSVFFTDAEGKRRETKVVYIGQVESNDFAAVSEGDWELAMFTCNFSGEKRVLVCCETVD